MKNQPKLAGNLHKYNFRQADSVWSIDGVCPTILAYNQGQIGHQINIMVEDANERESIRFLTSHGIVEAHEFDCVSLTFGMSKKSIPHSPVMSNGLCKTLTTMCDHDIGVIVHTRQGDEDGKQ